MIKPTEWEKEIIKKLLNHEGFKIIERMFDDYESQILSKYIIGNLNLRDEKILDALLEDKNYTKWGKDFINIIKGSIKWIGKKEV